MSISESQWQNDRYSIKKKLIRMSMTTSIVAVMLSGMVFLVSNIFLSHVQLIEDLKLSGKIISTRIGVGLAWEDKALTLQTLDDLKTKDSIVLACVYDAKKKLFVSYPENSTCPAFERSMHKNKDKLIRTVTEVLFNNHLEGYVYIVSDLRNVYQALPQYIIFTIVVTLCMLLIAYLIASRYQRNLFSPIEHLADTAAKVMKKNDFSLRAKKYDNDEIGDLSVAFNNMLQAIGHRDQKLANTNSKLQERTSELEKALQELQTAIEAKNQFLANMSHEIRTPNHATLNMSGFALNDLHSLIKTLQHDINKEENKQLKAHLNALNEIEKYIQKTHAASKRQANLLNNIIDLHKLAEGKIEFNFMEHDFTNCTKKFIEGYYDEQDRLNIEIPDQPLMAVYDRKKIYQVMENFMSNAVKYAPEGTITIRVKKSHFKDENGKKRQGIRFSISDEGIGIPAEELEHVFGKFNESSRTKNSGGGKGLGLAISAEIIAAHKGKIWAENNKKKGSSFYFIIPI